MDFRDTYLCDYHVYFSYVYSLKLAKKLVACTYRSLRFDKKKLPSPYVCGLRCVHTVYMHVVCNRFMNIQANNVNSRKKG